MISDALVPQMDRALSRRRPRTSAPVLVGVLILTLALRVYALDSKSLSFDELYSVFVARHALSDITSLIREHDTHPPLYYAMLRLWMATVGGSEVALRLLSVLAGTIMVLLTYLLAARLASPAVGLVAAFLVAVSPFHVQATQEARMYPWLGVWIWAGAWALIKWLDEDRLRWLVIYGLTTLLGLYTHYLAFFVLPAHVAYLIATRTPRRRLGAWAACLLAVAVLYLPWVPVLLQQVSSGRGWPQFRPPLTHHTITDLLGLLAFGGRLFGMGTYFTVGRADFSTIVPLLLPFLLLAAYGLFALPARASSCFLAMWGVIPVILTFAFSFKWNIFYPRYFSFLEPAFAIGLAAGMYYLAAGFSFNFRAALAGLLVLPVSFSIPVLAEYYAAPGYSDWRAASRYLEANIKPDDALLFVPAIGREMLRYYLSYENESIAVDPGEVLGSDVTSGRGALSARRIAAMARRHPRLWIIATLPLGYPARSRLNEILRPYFIETWGKDFHRVYLFLWKSTVGTASVVP